MMANVLEIFEEMSYEAVEENAKLGKEWLTNKKFTPFIHGIYEPVKTGGEGRVDINCVGGSTASVYTATSADLDKAVNSCLELRDIWIAKRLLRENYLHKIVNYLEKHNSLLAQVETLNRGVQVKDPAEFDVPALISWFKYYANWVVIGAVEQKEWRPHGIVAVVVYENTPLIALGWLVAPALAAGNCVCLCVPSKTSATAFLLAEIFVQAGLPGGVFNVIPASEETIEKLVLHKEITSIRAFGPTSWVREMKRKLSDFPLKTISSVMSGRTPMLVFDSADVHSAIESAVRSAWHNQGSTPWSLQVLLVQMSIFESFTVKLKQRLESLQIGNSFDKMADIGKPYDAKIVEDIVKFTALAKKSGLEVFQKELSSHELAQGFFPPTLVIGGDVMNNQVIESPEFPPVISVVPFRTAEEAVALANNSRYGLGASVWTNKLTLALDVSDRLQFGTVWVNCHGVMDPSAAIHGWKESGSGDFGGKAGFLDCFYWQGQKELAAANESSDSTTSSCQPVKVELAAADKSTDSTTSSSLKVEHETEISYKLYYGGGYKNANGNGTRSVVIRNNILLTFSDADRKDVRMAVEAASGSFGRWSKDANSRTQVLNTISAKIQGSKKKIIDHMLLTSEKGTSSKTFSDAVNLASAAFNYWASACGKFGEARALKPGFMVNVSREPLGVIGLGIYSSIGKETSLCQRVIWQLAAALALGNPVIVVIDLQNPSGVLELFKAIFEAGIPSGVLSVLIGNSFTVMKSLAEHQSVNAIIHWQYPSNLLKVIKLAACANMKPVKSAIEEHWRPETITAARECTEVSVTQSKAVWMSK